MLSLFVDHSEASPLLPGVDFDGRQHDRLLRAGHVHVRSDGIIEIVRENRRVLAQICVLRQHPDLWQPELLEPGRVRNHGCTSSDVPSEKTVGAVVSVHEDVPALVARRTNERRQQPDHDPDDLHAVRLPDARSG